VILTVASVMLASSVNSALAAGFGGTWVNTNANTRGVTQMHISEGRSSSKLRLWGSCHPRDCDWGTIRADNFSTNVSSKNNVALFGNFRKNFANTYVIVTKLRGRRLALEVLTKFKDRSGRSSYRNVYTFKRK